MSFKIWFRKWVRSFYRLMMVGKRPYKSEKQRKKERDRRLKEKYSPTYPLKKKTQHKPCCSGNHKVLEALCGFMAISLGILFLPFGLLHWGYKNPKTRRSSKKKAEHHQSTNPSRVTPNSEKDTNHHAGQTRTMHTNVRQQTQLKSKATSHKITTVETTIQTDEKKKLSVSYTTYAPTFEIPTFVPQPSYESNELDESEPKSIPKNDKDHYIKKRMIIAGSSYCSASVIAKLQIGTYFDLSREPDNPYDKDAVVLTLEGEKIGYVAKKDLSPFNMSLKLHRNIYGVITDIISENNFTKYEYETWFATKDM